MPASVITQKQRIIVIIILLPMNKLKPVNVALECWGDAHPLQDETLPLTCNGKRLEQQHLQKPPTVYFLSMHVPCVKLFDIGTKRLQLDFEDFSFRECARYHGIFSARPAGQFRFSDTFGRIFGKFIGGHNNSVRTKSRK